MATNTGMFPNTIVTNAGKKMIVQSQNGSTLTITRVALGDGVLGNNEDQQELTAIKSEKLSADISQFEELGNGQFTLTFTIDNSTIEKGFWHREIGIMAKVDDADEQLYAYTNAGSAASFLYDKSTPIQVRTVKIDIILGSAENVNATIDKSVVYTTHKDLEEHNSDTDAHAALVEKLNQGTAALLEQNNLYHVEATGYGIISGCEPSISGLTVTVGEGIIHNADGSRVEVAEQSIALDAADATYPRTDVVYLDANGNIAKITGNLGTPAVAGSNTYTINTNFAVGDTIAFDEIVFTCTDSTQDSSHFVVGSTIAASAANLATAFNASNAGYNYDSVANDAVITVTERNYGNGYTPGNMTVTGTGVIINGTATESVREYTEIPQKISDTDFIVCKVIVRNSSSNGIIEVNDQRKALSPASCVFLLNSVDCIEPYVIGLASSVDKDNTDVSTYKFGNQSLCVHQDNNGIAQELFMLNASTDNTKCEIAKFKRIQGKNGYVSWKYVCNNYVDGLGHADCAYYQDGYVCVPIGKKVSRFSADTLKYVDGLSTNNAVANYDPVNKKFISAHRAENGMKGRFSRFSILNTEYAIEKEIYINSFDNYISQYICIHKDMVYIVANISQYYADRTKYSVQTGMQPTALILCYDINGNHLKDIPINTPGEIEGIAVDDSGYVYLSVNGFKGAYNAIMEAPLFKNRVQSMRSPVSYGTFAGKEPTTTTTIWVDSCEDSKNFGVGLGLKDVPYTSLIAASYAIECLKTNSVVRLMHTHAPNKYDNTLIVYNGDTLEINSSVYSGYNDAYAGNDIVSYIRIENFKNIILNNLKCAKTFINRCCHIFVKESVFGGLYLSENNMVYFESGNTCIETYFTAYNNAFYCSASANVITDNATLDTQHNVSCQLFSPLVLEPSTIPLNNSSYSGIVTNSSTYISFMIPTPLAGIRVKKYALSGTFDIIQNGAYILKNAKFSDYNVTISKTFNGIVVGIAASAAIPNIVNNTPLRIYMMDADLVVS